MAFRKRKQNRLNTLITWHGQQGIQPLFISPDSSYAIGRPEWPKKVSRGKIHGKQNTQHNILEPIHQYNSIDSDIKWHASSQQPPAISDSPSMNVSIEFWKVLIGAQMTSYLTELDGARHVQSLNLTSPESSLITRQARHFYLGVLLCATAWLQVVNTSPMRRPSHLAKIDLMFFNVTSTSRQGGRNVSIGGGGALGWCER